MLTIKKRKGDDQPFMPEKIRMTLVNTGDYAGQPFNESDINGIIRELEGILEGKETVTSRQIYVILAGILYTRGFASVLDRYTKCKRNAWRDVAEEHSV